MTGPRTVGARRGTVCGVTRRTALVQVAGRAGATEGGPTEGDPTGPAEGRPEDAAAVRCALGGRLFDGSRREEETAAVVVGDEVEWEAVETEAGGGHPRGRITAVRPRRNELRRGTGPAERREMRTVAANLTRFLVVSAFREPPYRTGLLDRALALAYDAGIPPALVFNKRDLADDADRAGLEEALAPYRALELPVFLVSALTGEGIGALGSALGGERSVLFGHSGVGKTELLAALSGAERRRGGLDRRKRGRHTTTAAEIVALPGGGEIVDTPGVRALGLDGLTPERVAAAYPDLAPFAADCRFPGCSHRAEPDCAVRAAVEAGEVHPARHESLLRLTGEAAAAGGGRLRP